MYKRLLSLIIAASLMGSLIAHHKIVYLIATPRSLSTAFLRAMHARGDMSIFNEPSMKPFYCEKIKNIWSEEWYHPESPGSYKEAIDRLLAEAEHNPVFIKEHSKMVQPLLEQDDRILNDPHITFAFLLRNPHHSIISFYMKDGGKLENMSEEIGYKASYELIQLIQRKTGIAPVIVITEQLYNSPEETMRNFCKDVGIPFLPEAMHWSPLGDNFDGVKEWHQVQLPHGTHYWHGDAIASTGFAKPREYEVDTEGNPTFSEINNAEHRELCKNVYQENMHYYNLILQMIAF